MIFDTFATIRAAVEAELDLQDEVFILPADLLNFCNQGIHEAESIILKLNEDYFLTSQALATTLGSQVVALPSNIFANKIRRIVFSDGSLFYEVKRLRFNNKFVEIPQIQSSEDYRYMLENDASNGFQLMLYPAAAATGSAQLTMWYIRSAHRVAVDADTIEIPEFRAFIEKYMIMRCLYKEGHPQLTQAIADFEAEKTLMIDTLTERQPDDDNTLEADFSHYEEHN